jgi:hypothetical protein
VREYVPVLSAELLPGKVRVSNGGGE